MAGAMWGGWVMVGLAALLLVGCTFAGRTSRGGAVDVRVLGGVCEDASAGRAAVATAAGIVKWWIPVLHGATEALEKRIHRGDGKTQRKEGATK